MDQVQTMEGKRRWKQMENKGKMGQKGQDQGDRIKGEQQGVKESVSNYRN